MNDLKGLYKLEEKDITQAGVVLSNAFKNDPAWSYILRDLSKEERDIFYQFPLYYCMKHGTVYAPSEELEGIMAVLPGKKSVMSFLRVLSARLDKPAKLLGKARKKTDKLMDVLGRMLEKDRTLYMKGTPYTYIYIIGVLEEHQGKGYGKKMLNALIEDSELTKIPIYLETEPESNVGLYEHFGWEVINEIVIPKINIPMWEMLRKTK